MVLFDLHVRVMLSLTNTREINDCLGTAAAAQANICQVRAIIKPKYNTNDNVQHVQY